MDIPTKWDKDWVTTTPGKTIATPNAIDSKKDTNFNNLCRPGPPTPLIRGERNYFPEGVYRSRNLHTASVHYRVQLKPLETGSPQSLPPGFVPAHIKCTQDIFTPARLQLRPMSGHHGQMERNDPLPLNRELPRTFCQSTFAPNAAILPVKARRETNRRPSGHLEMPSRRGHITFHREVLQWLAESERKGNKEERKTSSGPPEDKTDSPKEQETKESPLDDSRYFNSSFSNTEEEYIPKEDLITAENNLRIKNHEDRKSPSKQSSKSSESSRSTPTNEAEHGTTAAKTAENKTGLGGAENAERAAGDKIPGFQVFMRIRPLEDTVADTNSTRLRSLTVENENQVLLCTRPSKGKESNGTKHLFTFARVFQESTQQRDVFEVTTQSVVEAVLKGHHACVVTYGIPNSGKSHTLYGKATSGKHRGVIMRAMEAMLNIIQSDANSDTAYTISTSFLQIYNEKFNDLLDPSASEGIKIHENGDQTLITGATRVTVRTADDVSKQLRRSPNRMRDAGSRSHTVFTVQLRKEEPVASSEGEDGERKVKVTEGEIRFVDLVGVERSVKHATYDSPAVGSAEAKTTRSLQLFSNAILALADDKNATVPYRDSKLTRLLRNALGGDCITRLIVTASPCPNLAHETLSCLQLAQKACQIDNRPVSKVETVIKQKPEAQDSSGENKDQDQNESPSMPMSSSSSSKLPPIHHHVGQQVTAGIEMNTSGSENSFKVTSEGQEPPTHTAASSGAAGKSPSTGRAKEAKRPNSSSPVKFTMLSGEEKRTNSNSSPEGLLYLQVRPSDSNTKTVSLPLLAASKAGHIVNQPSPGSPSLQFQQLQRSSSKSPNAESKRSSRTKSGEKAVGATVVGTFASTIQPAADSLINGGNSTPSTGRNRRNSTSKSKKRSSPTNPDVPILSEATSTASDAGSSVREETRECCDQCHAREQKIKADYDRMIIFSKKDRDEKQAKLEEALLEVKKLKNDAAPLSQLKILEEELALDKVSREIQTKEIARLEGLVESLKVKMSNMVSNAEHSALQELRRKEMQNTEDLKHDLENTKLKMKDEAEKQRKELANKNDVIKKLEREMAQLRKEGQDKEKQVQEAKKQQEEKAAAAIMETQRQQTRHETIVAEINTKLSTSHKEIARLKENETRLTKQWQEEKENLQRALALAKQNSTHAQAELKIAQGKLLSMDRERRIGRTSNGVTTNSAGPRIASRRGLVSRDAATAMSNSPVGEQDDVTCTRCRRQVDDEDLDVQLRRDEEVRILLLQDARNREILVQLKRERNLLCDVMKIMYCRQWFTEDASQHIKRTLKRVGIDTKSLNTLKKKA